MKYVIILNISSILNIKLNCVPSNFPDAFELLCGCDHPESKWNQNKKVKFYYDTVYT